MYKHIPVLFTPSIPMLKQIGSDKLAMVLLFVIFVLSVPMMYKYICKHAAKGKDESEKNRFIVYGYMQCPYTVKMIDELTSKGQSYKFVDVRTRSGHVQFKKVLGGRDNVGVPYTIDQVTGKHMLGYEKINL